MKEIVKIDVISLAKVIGLIAGGIYLLVGIIVNLIVLIFGLGSITGLDFLGFGSGLIATVLVDRKSTRLNSSHTDISRMPSSA